MKTLDRYLLREFFIPLGYCLFAFFLIMVVYDLFDNLSTFIKWGTPFWEVVGYYITVMPSNIPITLPMSMLLALLYCLSLFAKHSELVAMRASGLSLRRLMLPYVGIGIIGSLILFLMNESIVPKAVDRAQRFMLERKSAYKEAKEPRSDADNPTDPDRAIRWGRTQRVASLLFYNSRDRRHWIVQEFEREKKEIRNVEILQLDKSGREKWKIVAASGKFLDGKWWFFDVKIVDLVNLRTIDESRQRQMDELTETPKLLASMLKEADQMTVKELRSYLKVHKRLAPEKLAPFVVSLHQRFAEPWMCLVMVLLAVSIGTRVGRKGPVVGVASSLGLFVMYWIVAQVSYELGKNCYIPPPLAAWLPNCLFGSLGLIGYTVVR